MSTKILYVCELCHDNAPDCCGHFSPSELAVMPNGAWLCNECIDYSSDDELREYGVSFTDEDGRPYFKSFPHPPAYAPKAAP